MATTYTGSITVRYKDGYSESIAITADDVNANNWLGADALY
jgi:hypothetical protein